jgi:hypothetical protein
MLCHSRLWVNRLVAAPASPKSDDSGVLRVSLNQLCWLIPLLQWTERYLRNNL